MAIADTWPRTVSSATFVRAQSGTEVSAGKGTRIYPSSLNEMAMADVNIFFTGTNGGWNSANTLINDNDAADLVAITDKMISKTKNKDKYLVIGLIRGGADANPLTDAALKNAYGDHYIDAKGYLASEKALQDAGIIPTSSDLSYISAGKVHVSLLHTDMGHLNDAGYRLLSNLVYERMVQLGYCR